MKEGKRTGILEKELERIWGKIPALRKLILENFKNQSRVVVAITDKDNADNCYCATAVLQDISVRRWQSNIVAGENKDIITCTLSIIIHDAAEIINFHLQEVDGKDQLEIKADLNEVANEVNIEIDLL